MYKAEFREKPFTCTWCGRTWRTRLFYVLHWRKLGRWIP